MVWVSWLLRHTCAPSVPWGPRRFISDIGQSKMVFCHLNRERKLNPNYFFSNFSGAPRDIPAKSRDIPPKMFDFPGFEGRIELFGPHPFTWKTPTPLENIRTKKFGFGFLFPPCHLKKKFEWYEFPDFWDIHVYHLSLEDHIDSYQTSVRALVVVAAGASLALASLDRRRSCTTSHWWLPWEFSSYISNSKTFKSVSVSVIKSIPQKNKSKKLPGCKCNLIKFLRSDWRDKKSTLTLRSRWPATDWFRVFGWNRGKMAKKWVMASPGKWADKWLKKENQPKMTIF